MFTWKTDHKPDIGLVAVEVAAVEPLLVTRNAKNEVEGVKYDHLNVLLINAMKEQQQQITSLTQLPYTHPREEIGRSAKHSRSIRK